MVMKTMLETMLLQIGTTRHHADLRLANIQALGQFANTLAVRATEHDPRLFANP
jgi:hypothetical protein